MRSCIVVMVVFYAVLAQSATRAASDAAPVAEADSVKAARAAGTDALAADGVEEEPAGPIVARLEWKGVTSFEAEELEDRILTTATPRFSLRFWRPRPRLDEFVLQEDLDRIVEAYHEIGFYSAQADAHVRTRPDGRVVVEFTVREGLLVRLEEWSFEIEAQGDSDRPLSEAELERLRSHVVFAPEQAFGSRLYRERRSALLEDCGEMGFPWARISGGASVDPVLGRARVEWILQLGPRTRIGAIRIVGLERVDEEIVRRELRFESGDRFSSTSLRESERRLANTRLFRSVTIARSAVTDAEGQPTSDELDLEIRLEEAPPRSFRASLGYGTEDGPRVGASLTWRNFLGEARRLQVRGFASFLDSGFVASLGQPYVFGEWARADLAVSALRQRRPGYKALVTGASGTLTFYPDREGPWSLTLGPGYELARITDFDVDIARPLRGPRESVIVNWFTIGRYQRVDDAIDPRSGLRVELANELGGYPIGSDLDYQRWDLDLRLYRATGPVVWAARAAATTLDPLGEGLAAVPLTRRLYSGGTMSVRGYGFQKLGPTDAGNQPIGGLSRMELGLELRVPVWRSFGLVGFVDAGDVREDSWSWRPRNLRASAGPGLRIRTPVGPLRFDVGFPLNRPRQTDRWRFHLSVGQAF